MRPLYDNYYACCDKKKKKESIITVYTLALDIIINNIQKLRGLFQTMQLKTSTSKLNPKNISRSWLNTYMKIYIIVVMK